MEASTSVTNTWESGQTNIQGALVPTQATNSEEITATEAVTSHESEGPTTNQILTWVWVQILNLIIFFVIFWMLMGKKIIKWFEERKQLIKKVEHAEENYKKRMEDAEHESKKIIQEWLKRKEDIIAEAGSLASQRKDEIIEEAHHKAERLVEEAKKRNESLQVELENNFAKWVKQTAMSVLKKLLWKDKEIKTQYLDEIVNEVTK